jgi:predicted molibdopterin-dependent oxidoreductase YjgC
MRGSIAQMKRARPSLDNISWERIAREGSVTYPCDAEDQPGNEIVFGDGFLNASGRRSPGARRDYPAGRGSGCGIPDGADHRHVFIPFCYAEAAANVLTNPQLDPFGKIPEYKFCAAKVEPVAVRAAAE